MLIRYFAFIEYLGQDRQKDRANCLRYYQPDTTTCSEPVELKASPKTILKFPPKNWSIENGLHYVRDTAFREDHSQIRTQNAPRAMASLKNLVIGLFHFLQVTNIAKTLRNFAARPFLALQMLRW